MNCEQCQEEVLELIERASFDAAGVDEILSRCPECRAKFDELKQTLDQVSDLPLEAAAANVDARILATAGAHGSTAAADASSTRVVSIRPRGNPALPWAVAAVAALGVGLGIAQSTLWGGSDSEPLAQAILPEEASPDAQRSDTRDVDLDGESEEVASGAKDGGGERLAVATEALEAPRRKRTSKERPASPPKSARDESRQAMAQVSEAESAPATRGAFAGGAAPAVAADAAAPAKAEAAESEADVAEGAEARPSRSACNAQTRKLETKLASDPDYVPAPELQLEAGLCYADLNQRSKARQWLERAAKHDETAARAKAALDQLE